MPKSITIICSKQISLDLMINKIKEKFKSKDISFLESKNSFQMQKKINNFVDEIQIWKNINLSEIAIEEYSEYDGVTDYFIKELINYIQIAINYNSYNLITEVFKKILPDYKNFSNDIWIENDYGSIISYYDFINYLKNNIDWRIEGE